jgi:nitrogen fixation/metabolism regulation signal transduction histidine kinase
MLYVSLPLITVCAISFFSLYLGIWADVLSSFTDQRIQEDLITATRLIQYEEVRQNTPPHGLISVFRSAEKLSLRQREIFREILNKANRNVILKVILLLFFVAWGTVYVSHKIAGPIYHMLRIGREFENGNYKARIFLRKWDETHPLAEQMNNTYVALDQRFARIKKWAREKPPQEAVKLIQKELEATQTHDLAV